MLKIIVPAFYALQDSRTPVKVALIAMFLNIALNFLFIRPLQNGGPALATLLSAFFNSGAIPLRQSGLQARQIPSRPVDAVDARNSVFHD